MLNITPAIPPASLLAEHFVMTNQSVVHNNYRITQNKTSESKGGRERPVPDPWMNIWSKYELWGLPNGFDRVNPFFLNKTVLTAFKICSGRFLPSLDLRWTSTSITISSKLSMQPPMVMAPRGRAPAFTIPVTLGPAENEWPSFCKANISLSLSRSTKALSSAAMSKAPCRKRQQSSTQTTWLHLITASCCMTRPCAELNKSCCGMPTDHLSSILQFSAHSEISIHISLWTLWNSCYSIS